MTKNITTNITNITTKNKHPQYWIIGFIQFSNILIDLKHA